MRALALRSASEPSRVGALVQNALHVTYPRQRSWCRCSRGLDVWALGAISALVENGERSAWLSRRLLRRGTTRATPANPQLTARISRSCSALTVHDVASTQKIGSKKSTTGDTGGASALSALR